MKPSLLTIALGLAPLSAAIGCVENPTPERSAYFEEAELDACLALLVDMSGSFAAHWEAEAHTTFLRLMDAFFTEGAGGETRVVIGQLSGERRVVLFEGEPSELRSRFKTPEELGAFLRERSDPRGSPVYHATERAIDYVASMPRVGQRTRLLTVVLSDLVVHDPDGPGRIAAGRKMLAALRRYREKGGGLALYYVAQSEVGRWRRIVERAGFPGGSCVIQTELVANPQLPRFD